MMNQEIWLISREYAGLAEAGGVKDVTRGLSRAWAKLGYPVHVVLPFYGFMVEKNLKMNQSFCSKITRNSISYEYQIWNFDEEMIQFHLIKVPSIQSKMSVYTPSRLEAVEQGLVLGQGYPDSWLMNVEFQESFCQYITLIRSLRKVFIHLHDAHTALIPVILRNTEEYKKKSSLFRFVLSIHNGGKAYQQNLLLTDFIRERLPLSKNIIIQNEVNGWFFPLKAALPLVRLHTVSPGYAIQLVEPLVNDNYAGDLPSWIQSAGVPIKGTYNGIDVLDWDPAFTFLPQFSFDPGKHDFMDKGLLKTWFLEEHCPEMIPHNLLFIVQTRLTHQKGMHKLINVLPELFHELENWNLIVMGQGDQGLESAFTEFSKTEVAQGRFRYFSFYREPWVKYLLGSGDYFLMPSDFEPCGLTDLMAMMMGTVPVVHGIGGLQKNISGVTSWVYNESQNQTLSETIRKIIQSNQFSPDQRLDMASKGYQYVKDNFDWDQILKDIFAPWFLQET